MKSSKKGFDAHGNEHKTHKPSKHDANLQNNSTLHFQIGLLISCALVFLTFQINFKVSETIIDKDTGELEIDNIYVMTDYTKYVEPKKKVFVKETQVNKKSQEYKKVSDETEINKAQEKVLFEEPSTASPVDPNAVVFVEPRVDVVVDFEKVEFVPIFPGCESLKTNAERKKCMSEKIDRIVRRNFRTNKAIDYGLTGKQRIYVQFKINKQGLVSDVKVRAPHKVLEDETRRVTELIPQMKPGRQRNQDVEVVFIKPILFQVQ